MQERGDSYQGVQRLICGFTSIEAVIDLMLPRTHLDGADELRLEGRLAVELREKSRQVLANEMRLRLGTGIERR